MSQIPTATPLGAGKNLIAFSPSAYGFGIAAFGGESSLSTSSGLLPMGTIDILYRRGFTDNFDMGVQISGWGNIMFDGKINLVNTPVLALSVDPGIGGFFTGVAGIGAGYLQFNAPLLIDLKLGRVVTITAAAKYIGVYLFATETISGTSQTAKKFVGLVGGNLGIEFKLGKVFRLMPHGGVFFWHNNPELSSGSTSVGIAAAWFTGGLAFKFKF